MKKHVFFLVRYSLLTTESKGWRLTREPDYRDRLFDPGRLEARRWLFENLTAPALAANARTGGISSSTLVLISPELPVEEQQALARAVQNIPGGELVTLSGATAYPEKALRQEIRGRLAALGEEVVYATVQVDDDDILASDTLATLRGYVNRAFRRHVVSFARGYTGEFSVDDRKFTRFRHLYAPKLALGLAYINAYDPTQDAFHDSNAVTIYGLGSHVKVDEKRATIVLAKIAAWIRTLHSSNDVLVPGKNRKADNWHLWLTPAPLTEVTPRFKPLEIPVVESDAIRKGEKISGRLRQETQQNALRRMLAGKQAEPSRALQWLRRFWR